MFPPELSRQLLSLARRARPLGALLAWWGIIGLAVPHDAQAEYPGEARIPAEQGPELILGPRGQLVIDERGGPSPSLDWLETRQAVQRTSG